jgi:hypothetical protein
MNNKIKFLGTLAAMAAFAFPIAASASATTNQVTLNGGPNATVSLGSTVQGNVNFTMTSGTDVESFSYQIVDNTGNAALPPVCIDSTDHTSAGVYNSSFPVGTGGQTEGTWAIKIRLYGDTGVGVDNQCNRPSDLLDTFTSPEILTITSPTDSTTQTGNPFPGDPNGFCALFPADCSSGNTGLTDNTGFGSQSGFGSSLNIFCLQHPLLCGIHPPVVVPPPTTTNSSTTDAILAALNAILVKLTPGTGGTGANSQVCQGLIMVQDSLNVGSRGIAVSNLQVFLMAHGGNIPALGNGAAYGYFGQQTAAALWQVRSANGCN